VTSALEGGRLSALRTGRRYPQESPGTQPRALELSDATEKIPSDTTGIDPETYPTSNCLNHYATPGPQ
jgi:hypothetical protein